MMLTLIISIFVIVLMCEVGIWLLLLPFKVLHALLHPFGHHHLFPMMGWHHCCRHHHW